MFKGYCPKNDVICHAQIPCFAFLLIFRYMQLLVSVIVNMCVIIFPSLKLRPGNMIIKNNRLKSVSIYIAF